MHADGPLVCRESCIRQCETALDQHCAQQYMMGCTSTVEGLPAGIAQAEARPKATLAAVTVATSPAMPTAASESDHSAQPTSSTLAGGETADFVGSGGVGWGC